MPMTGAEGVAEMAEQRVPDLEEIKGLLGSNWLISMLWSGE